MSDLLGANPADRGIRISFGDGPTVVDGLAQLGVARVLVEAGDEVVEVPVEKLLRLGLAAGAFAAGFPDGSQITRVTYLAPDGSEISHEDVGTPRPIPEPPTPCPSGACEIEIEPTPSGSPA